MSEQHLKDTVILVADVTASVALYEAIGDAAAYARIANALDLMRAAAESVGGTFVQSRGDDVLCVFADAEPAVKAAEAMLTVASGATLELHVAIHAGEAILARESIFGDAVNVAYRLASIANTNEVLASGEAADKLPLAWRRVSRPLRAFRFKGRAAPVDVIAIEFAVGQPMTQLPDHMRAPTLREAVILRLSYAGKCWEVTEAESLSIGRAEGVDVLIERPWVSRRHAVMHVRDGAATITDRSSYGSFIKMAGGTELRIRRQSIHLSGEGAIGLGTSVDADEAERLTYEVVSARAVVGV